jgi:hypothetical protein
MTRRPLLLMIMLLLPVFMGQVEKKFNVSTTLVIVEEQENEKFIAEGSPVTDGIFDALWDKSDYIFFDISVKEPIKTVFDELDVKQYMMTAKESGADSILLIKFHYFSDTERTGIRLKASEYSYNLYSLNEMKTLRSGKIRLKIDELVDVKAKEGSLKRLGVNILNEIYK